MILKGVPERTKKKIVLLGKDYKKRLLAYMDPSSVDRIMKYRNLEDESDNPLKKDIFFPGVFFWRFSCLTSREKC